MELLEPKNGYSPPNMYPAVMAQVVEAMVLLPLEVEMLQGCK